MGQGHRLTALIFWLLILFAATPTIAEAKIGRVLSCVSRIAQRGAAEQARARRNLRQTLGGFDTQLPDRINPAVPNPLYSFDAQVISVDTYAGTEQIAVNWSADYGDPYYENEPTGVEIDFPDGSYDYYALDGGPVIYEVPLNSGVVTFYGYQYNYDGFSDYAYAEVDTYYDPGSPPGGDIQLTSGYVDDNSAHLSWTSSVSDVYQQTLYGTDGYSEYTAYGTFSPYASNTWVTDLYSDTTYTFYLEQEDIYGNFYYSNEFSVTTDPGEYNPNPPPVPPPPPPPPPPPTAPSLFVNQSLVTETSATFTFVGGTPTTTYSLQQAPYGTSAFSTVISGISGIDSGVTVFGLSPYTRYNFRLTSESGTILSSNVVPVRTDFSDSLVTTYGYADLLVAGPATVNDGNIAVHIYSGQTELGMVHAFDGTTNLPGGVYLALGDVNGDGAKDIIVAAGAGGLPRIQVISGADGKTILFDRLVLEASFTGGVQVASADLNGDGFAEIITGTGIGGGPRITVIDGKTGTSTASFFAYEASFRGGVEPGVGDVNGDGRPDILTGTGPGGGPRVIAFDGIDYTVIMNFFAYESTLRTGVFVAAGDFNGDGIADIVAGNGPGGGPRIVVIDSATQQPIQSFFAGDSNKRDGVIIAVYKVGGVRRIAAGPNAGGASVFTVYSQSGDPLFPKDLGEIGNNGVRLGGTD